MHVWRINFLFGSAFSTKFCCLEQFCFFFFGQNWFSVHEFVSESTYFFSGVRCHITSPPFRSDLSNFYFVDRVRLLIQPIWPSRNLVPVLLLDRSRRALSIDAKIVPFRSILRHERRNCYPTFLFWCCFRIDLANRFRSTLKSFDSDKYWSISQQIDKNSSLRKFCGF